MYIYAEAYTHTSVCIKHTSTGYKCTHPLRPMCLCGQPHPHMHLRKNTSIKLTLVKTGTREQGMQRGARHADGCAHTHIHTACMRTDLRGVPAIATRSVHTPLCLWRTRTHTHTHTHREYSMCSRAPESSVIPEPRIIKVNGR